ncbi:MAG: nucleotidyltransferase family protein [Negativicutes bacterium]|jgi:hypothetical protein
MSKNIDVLNRETRLLLKFLQDNANQNDVEGIDAEKFFETCQRHRLVNIICQRHAQQVAFLPRIIRQRLVEENRKSSLRQLQNIAAMERVCAEFARLGIRYQLIKGAVLARLLYDDVGARMSRDVDFIICQPHFNQACAVLEKLGYQTKDFATAMHHSYVNTDDVIVELHSQLSVFGMKLDGSQSVSVKIAGRDYQVPDANEYFVYLCYHGAVHGWYRLLWLVDIVEFSVQSSKFGVDFIKIAAIAKKYGLLDVVGQALVLACELLGAEIPETFCISKRAELLAADAWELAIIRDCSMDDCFSFILQPKREFLYQLRVQGNIRNRLIYLLTPTVEDRRQFALPERFAWLYYCIRPILLLKRMSKKIRNLRKFNLRK